MSRTKRGNFEKRYKALGHLHAKAYVHGGVLPEQIFAIGYAIKLSAENIHSAGSHEELFADAPKFLAPERVRASMRRRPPMFGVRATLYECDAGIAHVTVSPYDFAGAAADDCVMGPRSGRPGALHSGRNHRSPSAKRAAAAAAIGPTIAPSPRRLPSSGGCSSPVAAPAVICPAEGSYRPPVLGARYDANPKRQGVPVWAYGAGVVVIILGLILLLRPKSTERRAAPPPVSTPTLPSAQQKEIPPSSEAAAKSRGGATPSRRRRVHGPSQARKCVPGRRRPVPQPRAAQCGE